MPQARKVVFIMTDTQRKDMVGCYGHPDMYTPSLDRLAQEGVRFDRAYTCQPVCGPARAALFTGTFPHTNGSWGNNMPLGEGTLTLGQRLSAHDIHTAYIGKWHLDASDYFGLGKCPDGWDKKYWYDMRNYLGELSPRDRARSRRSQTNQEPGLTEEFTYAHRCSNRAIDFLARHHKEDFFLSVSFDEPHGPYLCPQPYAGMYSDYLFPKAQNVWDNLKGKPSHQKVWSGDMWKQDKDALQIRWADYLGCNSFVDHEIGRVLEAIDRFAPEALVIYTSDHGDMMFSHSLKNKGAVMYDEITNIPFLVRWPGKVRAGSVCPHPISHIDLTPTILNAMGVKDPGTMEGKSLLPAFRAPHKKTRETVFMEFTRYEVGHDGFGGFQPIRACFDGRFKLVVNLMTSDELYDLKKDPGEIKNLILSRAYAKVRNRLHDRLLNWMDETMDPFRGYYWECRPWRKDARKPTWVGFNKFRCRGVEGSQPHPLDYETGLSYKGRVIQY